MKIALAQIQPIAGSIATNMATHLQFIERAAKEKVKLIVFPELSLTGYEPRLAKTHTVLTSDGYLQFFRDACEKHHITIAVGAPVQADEGIAIGMLIFQRKPGLEIYEKQLLHPDEELYFTPGKKQLIFDVKKNKIAPAICYESLQPKHAAQAKALGAEMYMVSAAKTGGGMIMAEDHYAEIAKTYQIPVLVCNSIGFCDDFMSEGLSAVWDKNGKKIAQLSTDTAGLLIYDSETNIATTNY